MSKIISLIRNRFKRHPYCFMILSILGIVVVSVGIYAYFIEPRCIQIASYEITDNQIPPGFDGTTIILITDIHFGRWGTFDLRKQIISLTKSQNPDLILFGGDYVNGGLKNMNPLAESLKSLSAPLGKFAVLGNHDYAYSYQKTLEILQSKGGIESLSDRGIWLTKGGDKIRLVGTEFLWDPNFPLQFPYYEISNLNQDDFVILLTHSPDAIERFADSQKAKIDLVLSGHSHGGQITFFGLHAPVSVLRDSKFLSGRVDLYNMGKRTTVITSNGIGTVGIPFRFFAVPQIVKITLKRTVEAGR